MSLFQKRHALNTNFRIPITSATQVQLITFSARFCQNSRSLFDKWKRSWDPWRLYLSYYAEVQVFQDFLECSSSCTCILHSQHGSWETLGVYTVQLTSRIIVIPFLNLAPVISPKSPCPIYFPVVQHPSLKTYQPIYIISWT